MIFAMADILGKDQATYSKEHDGFLRDLQHFHDTRGTPFKRTPTLGGKEVDLYLLYTLVTSQGGWIKVNSKNAWPEILQNLNLPKACVNGSVALKQIYLRYLDRFEKVHFLHEEADRASDDDEESRHKRWSARALHSVPNAYNYNQHNVNESNRESNHLSTDLYKPSDYDRLALSLISPLPNEQDFAINVCTLLSNDGKHTLKLEKHPRILNYLLGHAGIFTHSSLRLLFLHFYNDIRKKPITNFWKDMIESKEFLDLTNEDKFKIKQDEETPKYDSILKDDTSLLSSLDAPMEVDAEKEEVCEISDSDSDIEIEEQIFKKITLKIDLTVDKELFCLRSIGTQDYIGQRVLQIATILRNLSYIEENIPILTKNTTFIRFLLLCVTSQWGHLKNLGMDMLGNIASDFIVKDLQTDLLARNLVKIVTKGLESQDRASCLCSLEVLNKLSQNEKNEDVLLRSLQAQVYKSVCSFLSIHDVMLLIYTLECLYSLSSLGERSCNLIVINHGVIDTLVSLVTVEGKSYGPKACIGMKLVETVPTGQVQNLQTQSSVSSNTTTTTSTMASGSSNSSSSNTNSTLTTTTVSIATPVSTSASTSRSTTPTIPSTPVRSVQIVPQRLIAVTPTPVSAQNTQTTVSASVTQSTSASQAMTPQQLIQQQHAHQQAIHENEQFALAWLRATYEPVASGKVEQQELYKQYINSCSKIGRRGVISPLHFPRCVRSVFGGTVGPNPMKPSNPNEPQFYEGIKVRDKPLVINIQTSPVPKTSTNITTTKGQQARRKSVQGVVISPAKSPLPPSTALSVVAETQATDITPMSPASPILKAQLSAPPKQKESAVTPTPTTVITKSDAKTQVMAHPHLSQALLGTSSANSSSTLTTSVASMSTKDQLSQSSSTSLIKSLLATKVNDCMTTVSMRTATDCQNVAQVAARQQQQRLLAQQTFSTPDGQQKFSLKETPKNSRLNGVRQLFADTEIGDPSVSSTTQFTGLVTDKKEPPQPPPPPLAPLSNNVKGKSQRLDNEDSDSIGNNSIASSSGLGTVGIGGISSTEDGDNSLTSFEGLLNGIPNIENALNEDSNSKDSSKVASSDIYKPLRLADLLEKKIEKSPPILNGALGKELRLGDKSLDLVENHIEKVLNRDSESNLIVKNEIIVEDEVFIKTENVISKNEMVADDVYLKSEIGLRNDDKVGLKRSASEEIIEINAKKPLLSTNINGTLVDSPPPSSVSSSNGDDSTPATVSTAAAKLFADIAADILEDEDEEQLLQEAQVTTQIIESPAQVQISSQGALQQLIMDNNQQVLLTQPRQIIVSQPQIQATNQVVFSAGTQLKTPTGQTVIVQNTASQRPVMIQQANTGQFLLSQNLQGQMQLVASSQPGQYVFQASGQQGAYVVAQPQTTMVHGQHQAVLLAQTTQQQGTSAKTIIILQQQPPPTATATHHQKVVVTPQGQQMVVTQVPRPIVHTSTVSNTNVVPSSSKVIKSMPICSSPAPTPTTATTSNGVMEKKKEIEQKKPKVSKDLAALYVCEWSDCTEDKKFKSANEVYLHACTAHCPTGNEEVVCQWDRCDNMKRRRFSLMTHLHDKHCNTEAMRQGLLRRKQAVHNNKVESSPSASTNIHPGYAPDAALHAIKRHALEFVNPKELQDDNEGPVTKSIRLTASLILRNLVIYSSHCKRYLKSYETHLANVALSNVESSRTIAQVLYDMNDGSTHR